MSCTSNQDCPSDATCCDGSDESCDGTRLPSADGANPGELVVSADGLTVTDTTTGLLWQRDGSGPHAGCSDSEGSCTWAEAKAYCAALTLGGVSGWRLPGVMELLTIVDVTTAWPSINPTAFPNTPADSFWTSSPDTGSSGDAWCVDFNKGHSLSSDESGNCGRVRCVRGSRCYPTNRFVVPDSGLVRDTLTHLVWQQQASTTDMAWADVQSYCPSGFRLPTMKELMSIVDLTVASGPRINQAAFPNTQPENFWTSSWSADIPSWAWAVMFSSGYSHEIAMDHHSWVRCVR
jgi:hypothetical protein